MFFSLSHFSNHLKHLPKWGFCFGCRLCINAKTRPVRMATDSHLNACVGNIIRSSLHAKYPRNNFLVCPKVEWCIATYMYMYLPINHFTVAVQNLHIIFIFICSQPEHAYNICKSTYSKYIALYPRYKNKVVFLLNKYLFDLGKWHVVFGRSI